MTRIIHLSADYPDAVQPHKTRAIAALVEGTEARLEHLVYSLNRRGGWRSWVEPGRLEVVGRDGIVRSCVYRAPARGFRLATAMEHLAAAIALDLQARGEKADLVHGHKLTMEGLAAQALARRLNVPYLLTLQGNTDQKLIRARPDLKRRWRHCWHDAAAIMSFAPWATDWVGGQLGRRGDVANIPCILASDAILPPVEAPALVRTAFNLQDWQNKNIAALATAVASARKRVPDLKLEIAGAGPRAAETAVTSVLIEAGIGDIARRVGPIERHAIQQWMNGAALFALPSRRETFGMVFAEAVLAGCPILYPAGAAVDGFFDGMAFARGVPATDTDGLADAIVDLIQRQVAAKDRLGRWQGEGGAARFQRHEILERYVALVDSACS